MCGIGGIMRTDGKRIPAAWVNAIDARIAHRGPDDGGRFNDRVEIDEGGTPRAVEIVLIHRRLSIIDLECGAQPMVSPAGRDEREGLVAVVANGCIYNHRELRKELEREGHRFATSHSDTEVLLHGYRQWGERLTEHLEGMYAFALWDRGRQALVLARDWFGEKPLWVRRGIGSNPNVTAFASDARGLAELSSDRLPRRDEPAIQLWTDTYLQLGYSPGRISPFASAGDDGVASVAPTIVEHVDDLMASPREALSEDGFEALIDQAVGRRLEADVPLGCFLSGGVDSSLVAFFAKRRLGTLATFTVRMPQAAYDESPQAAEVAEHLGTDHHTLDVAPEPADDLVKLVGILGQPFGDSSLLPTYWVSRAARSHVKVALSGDGGDELFAGYERYVAARHLARHRRVLRWLPQRLLRGSPPKSRRHKLGRLGDMARDLDDVGIMAMESLFTREQIVALLGGLPERKVEQPLGFDPLQSLRRADLVHYLPNDLMLKVDTASMAVGLEVRAPLLDRDLARAALSAPTWQLLPRGRRKGLLRSIARRHLPHDVAERPKMGFAVPVGQWFRNDFGGMRTLLLDHLRSSEPFGPIELDRRAVKRLVDQHLQHAYDHGQRLFALLTLSIWARSL